MVIKPSMLEEIIHYLKQRESLTPRRFFFILGLIDPLIHLVAAPGIPFEEEIDEQFKRETEGALYGVTTFGEMIMTMAQESNLGFLDALIKAVSELSYVLKPI